MKSCIKPVESVHFFDLCCEVFSNSVLNVENDPERNPCTYGIIGRQTTGNARKYIDVSVNVGENITNDPSVEIKAIERNRVCSISKNVKNEDNLFLNILYWNCHGFLNFRDLDKEQLLVLRRCEVISLCETWETKQFSSIAGFTDYNIVQSEAIKTEALGRGSGGLLLLIKNCLKFKILRVNNFFIFVEIFIECKSIIVGLVYLRSGYVADSLDVLEDFLESNRDFFCSVPTIVGGDFNCWVGELNQSYDDLNFRFSQLCMIRASNDKRVNSCGKKLVEIMEYSAFYLINGRSISDNPAQFTFVSKGGKSIVDFVWVNSFFVNVINDLEVSDFLLGSDHLPVLVKTRVSVKNLQGQCYNGLKDNTRMTWCEIRDLDFKNYMLLSENLNGFEEIDDTEYLYNNLIAAIREGASQLGMIRKVGSNMTFVKNKPWYDRECKELKINLRKSYRKAKNQDFSAETLSCFLENKRAYKSIVNCKIRLK